MVCPSAPLVAKCETGAGAPTVIEPNGVVPQLSADGSVPSLVRLQLTDEPSTPLPQTTHAYFRGFAVIVRSGEQDTSFALEWNAV
ncbi:hypothetical protein D3C86_2092980 [compost metagenome]